MSRDILKGVDNSRELPIGKQFRCITAIDGQVMVKCCLPRPTAVFFAAITVTGYELHLCQAGC